MEDKYQQIIQEIENKINTNGNNEITGAILQGVLLGIIAAVQANLQGKLQYYSEDTDIGSVDIDCNSDIVLSGEDRIYLHTPGYNLLLSEEEGIKIESIEYTFEMKPGEGVKINDEPVLTNSDLSFVSRVIGVNVFSEATQYTTGDLVMYYNLLYRFTTNHIGEWNFSDVQETNLRELLNF